MLIVTSFWKTTRNKSVSCNPHNQHPNHNRMKSSLYNNFLATKFILRATFSWSSWSRLAGISFEATPHTCQEEQIWDQTITSWIIDKISRNKACLREAILRVLKSGSKWVLKTVSLTHRIGWKTRRTSITHWKVSTYSGFSWTERHNVRIPSHNHPTFPAVWVAFGAF